MNARIACLAACLVLAAGAHAQSVIERAERDQIANMPVQEPAMRKALERAQLSLDTFLARAKSPPPGTTGYAVMVGIRDGLDTEYLWVNQVTAVGSYYSGTISNVPQVVRSVRAGQLYTFSRSQIVDWTYLDQVRHKTLGNFTACALLTREPQLEAEEFKRRNGLDCE